MVLWSCCLSFCYVHAVLLMSQSVSFSSEPTASVIALVINTGTRGLCGVSSFKHLGERTMGSKTLHNKAEDFEAKLPIR